MNPCRPLFSIITSSSDDQGNSISMLPLDIARDYEFVSRSGRGGFGKVEIYVRKQPDPHPFDDPLCQPDTVAIKTWHGPSSEKYVQRELEAAKIFQDAGDHIIQFYGQIKVNGRVTGLVMECMDGSLWDYIRSGRSFHSSKAAAILLKAALGLKVMHQVDFIHRDIHPGNILIRVDKKDEKNPPGITWMDARPDSMKVKISDLSLTRGDVSKSMTGRVGYAHYIPPEIRDSTKADYSNKVDIYSLGVIFAELVTSRNLVGKIGNPALLPSFIQEQNYLPIGTRNLIADMILMNSTERPDIDSLIARLRELVEVEPETEEMWELKRKANQGRDAVSEPTSGAGIGGK